MEFYSVKHREKINVADNDIKKRKFNSGEGEGRIRYAAVAEVTYKGDKVKLTKFINKATYEDLKVPEV